MQLFALLRELVVALGAVSVASLAAGATEVPILAMPRLGHQGKQRHSARAAFPLLRALDPPLRYLAGLVSVLPLQRLRARQQRLLCSSGFPLGITHDELSALSLVSGGALALLVSIPVLLGKASPPLVGVGLVLGVALPTLRIRELKQQRAKAISRELPHSIEIAAMCMNAGLDFPGAIRLVSQPWPGSSTPLGAELRLVLEELDLGHTRREALLAFADRVPTDPVRDFVSAVIQAEERGNPLAQVLRIQGQVLGRRRSTRAEEAAARAGVMLVLPLLLLLSCVLVLLVGPAVLSNGLFR